MAKKSKEPKKVLERTYNVPLRKEWLKVARYKRAKKAAKALKEFIIQHMKPGLDEKGKINVKILKHANEDLWKNGIKNPPHHIKVNAVKDEKGKVLVQLEGKEMIEDKPGEEKKKAEKKPGEEKKKEEKAEEAKKEAKEEIKEAKKEPEVLPKKNVIKEPKEFKSEKADTRAPKADQGIARGEHKEK